MSQKFIDKYFLSEETHEQIDKAVSANDWQKFRKSLKGSSTSTKLSKLSGWIKKKHGSKRAKLQVRNYKGALKRGGLL